MATATTNTVPTTTTFRIPADLLERVRAIGAREDIDWSVNKCVVQAMKEWAAKREQQAEETAK